VFVCETRSLILTVFENRLLRRMSAHGRGEEAEEWRKLHDEEFKNAYASPNTEVTKLRRMGLQLDLVKTRSFIRIMDSKHERKRPRGRTVYVQNTFPLLSCSTQRGL
jgi:hypothetical protein